MPVAAGRRRKVSNLVKFYAALSIYLLFHAPAGAPGITGLRTVSSAPPPPVIPGECTKLERGRSSTPKRSKLTPHFRKRIFCCAVYPLLVVCVRVSLDSHIEGTPVYLVGNTRERGADRLRRRYSLAEQRL